MDTGGASNDSVLSLEVNDCGLEISTGLLASPVPLRAAGGTYTDLCLTNVEPLSVIFVCGGSLSVVCSCDRDVAFF